MTTDELMDEIVVLRASLTALAAEKEEYEQEIRQMLWLHHGCVTALYGDDGEMQCGRHCLDFKRQPLGELREAVRSIKWQLLGEAAERAKKQETEFAAVSTRLAQVTQELANVQAMAREATGKAEYTQQNYLAEHAKNQRLTEASAILRTALETYAQHKKLCPAITPDQFGYDVEGPCNCGLAEVLALSAPTKPE